MTSITRNRSAPLIVSGMFTISYTPATLISLFQTHVLVDYSARSVLFNRAPRTVVFVVSSCRGRSSPYLRWRFPTKKVTHILKHIRERNKIRSRQNDSCLSKRFAQQIIRFPSAQNRCPKTKTKKKSSKRVRSISPNLKDPQAFVSTYFLDTDYVRLL